MCFCQDDHVKRRTPETLAMAEDKYLCKHFFLNRKDVEHAVVSYELGWA